MVGVKRRDREHGDVSGADRSDRGEKNSRSIKPQQILDTHTPPALAYGPAGRSGICAADDRELMSRSRHRAKAFDPRNVEFRVARQTDDCEVRFEYRYAKPQIFTLRRDVDSTHVSRGSYHTLESHAAFVKFEELGSLELFAKGLFHATPTIGRSRYAPRVAVAMQSARKEQAIENDPRAFLDGGSGKS
jgi:hypothetical protein